MKRLRSMYPNLAANAHPRLALGLLICWIIALSGCNNQPVTVLKSGSTSRAKVEKVDSPGPDSDLFVLLQEFKGRLRVEQEGKLRLYIVDPDGVKIKSIDAVDVYGHIQPEFEAEGIRVVLKPDPQPGDAEGQSSEFVGDIPEEFRGKGLIAALNLTVKGERYRASFRSTPLARNHMHDWMARGVSAEEQKKLYLEPGGSYTQADITANGNIPASYKFRGQMAAHDMFPKPGDTICPITRTKANPQFTWIVAGKPYEFCCPPCIDEFVKLAKESPEEIKPPGEYVKKGK